MKLELKKRLEAGQWWYKLYVDGKYEGVFTTEERGTNAFNETKQAIESNQPLEFTILSEEVRSPAQQG
jgi:hypothetical protein